MNSLAKLLEAALFASPRPIPTDERAALDDDASKAAIAAALEELREHYNVDGHGVELVEQGGGWQILTRPEYTEAIERALQAHDVAHETVAAAASGVAGGTSGTRNAIASSSTRGSSSR